MFDLARVQSSPAALGERDAEEPRELAARLLVEKVAEEGTRRMRRRRRNTAGACRKVRCTQTK